MRINSLLSPAFRQQKTTTPFKFGAYKDTRSMLDYAKPKNKRISSFLGM